eukprot:CAMPEP_0195040820 /NCGR_PEP_ID=MMETSP0326_2-20130528/80540_1 /TAXON_ID=2866 ORGANISM="Crypthecodinium cohnii, Strain Seligo" /NCGR_SAMPLE_ID=MMETSP0326_2 /ASSEMBLY_ACC=CAM_ASM_000348 /LENGTH=99 /DNA_ID=CAMNT_0040067767 /DNA_START=478 /DNA_END=777 /DNA_ORIENTATION=+
MFVGEGAFVARGVQLFLAWVLSTLFTTDVPIEHHAVVLVRQEVAMHHDAPSEVVQILADDELVGHSSKDCVMPVAHFVPGVLQVCGDDLGGVHMRVEDV